eukprot:1160110-Pelagomonas_calceolata.AAC.2
MFTSRQTSSYLILLRMLTSTIVHVYVKKQTDDIRQGAANDACDHAAPELAQQNGLTRQAQTETRANSVLPKGGREQGQLCGKVEGLSTLEGREGQA